jgi:hypothetical protein
MGMCALDEGFNSRLVIQPLSSHFCPSASPGLVARTVPTNPCLQQGTDTTPYVISTYKLPVISMVRPRRALLRQDCDQPLPTLSDCGQWLHCLTASRPPSFLRTSLQGIVRSHSMNHGAGSYLEGVLFATRYCVRTNILRVYHFIWQRKGFRSPGLGWALDHVFFGYCRTADRRGTPPFLGWYAVDIPMRMSPTQ